MNGRLDPTFADGLRVALVDHVGREAAARKRRWWRRAIGVGVGLVLVGGGVAAAAQGVLPLPGADQVTDLGGSTSVTHTGTSTVDLGSRPDGATDVELRLRCLSAGTFFFADGASMSCSAADAAAGKGDTLYTLPLSPGQHTTTIRTTHDARWTLTVKYSKHVPTSWATNANGQTYGVANDRDQEPDLIAAVATNGKQGYVYGSQLNGPAPANPSQAVQWSQQDKGHSHAIPVYTSDGTTEIGEFVVPGVARTGAPAPQPQAPTASP